MGRQLDRRTDRWADRQTDGWADGRQTIRYKYKCAYLIFIQLTVLVFLFSLVLEGNDDKTYEDVHHEESNDDDEDEVEDGDKGPGVVYTSFTLLVRVNRNIQ